MHLLCCMADIHLRTSSADVADEVSFRAVGARNLISLGNKHLRQAGHAAAADADHMDSLADIIADMCVLHAILSCERDIVPVFCLIYYTPVPPVPSSEHFFACALTDMTITITI